MTIRLRMSPITRFTNGRMARGIAMWNWARHLPEWLQAWLVRKSGLFDIHRQQSGGTGVHPLFDPVWYCNRYKFNGSHAEALLHYRILGDRLGLSPSPWFDTRFFRRHYGIRARRGCALATFIGHWREFPIGNPLFDPEWYLNEYPDVSSEGANPLVHFVEHGIYEGRSPNAFVTPNEYLELNPDVGVAGLNPLRHFFLHGAFEGRLPSRRFNPSEYSARYPDSVRSGLHPLAHYLVKGRALGYTIPRVTTMPADLLPFGPAKLGRRTGTVDLVVPVYRGLAETRGCIESVLASRNSVSLRLWIHNDASPEPEVTAYLREVAARHPEVRLVENEENLGFVGTVNNAMRAALDFSDSIGVLLLNSDTVVAGNWVDRMVAHLQPKVASVTALSNNATICSYPRPGAYPMPAGCSTGELDSIASNANGGSSVEIPTGVGFCMLIGREALEVVGIFDEAAFGKGYGEENDFCMRAAQVGFRHLLAMDVFVQHLGEVSFADTSKPGKLRAEDVIAKRHPSYSRSVSDWIRRDPAALGRIRITLERWKSDAAPTWLLVGHSLGGGTARHVATRASELTLAGNHVVIMEPAQFCRDAVTLRSGKGFDEFQVDVLVEDGRAMTVLFGALAIEHIEVHHLLGYGTYMREALARFERGFDFFAHDYYSICPQVTLTDAAGRYCGELGLAACDSCIAARPTHDAQDIRNWRISNEWMIKGANAVFAPSRDAAERIDRYFQRRPKVAYHEDAVPARRENRAGSSQRDRLRVVLIGVLAPHKGQRLVLDAACAASKRKLPIEFHLIGDPQAIVPKEASGSFSWTGWYEEDELPRLIDLAEPDVFLFASQAPETFSFTLTKAMSTGLPILATRLGAFPERLEKYPDALLFDPGISGADLANLIVARFGNRFELVNGG